MKGIQYLFFVLFLGLSLRIVAQPSGSDPRPDIRISGRVLDQQSREGLEYATLRLYNSGDSALVSGTVSDSTGAFELVVAAGSYYAIIDFLGYRALTISGLRPERGSRHIDLGERYLEPEYQSLDEVEISATKSRVRFEVDKKVFDVGQDLASIGGSISDALDNIPSVTVDIDGNVALRGSANVRILIDGKPSGLVGISSADALRQIPANLVDRVEVITNPSARYDAEGSAGIINIVLKKEKKSGWNGFVDLSSGIPQGHNGSVSVNKRQGDLNVFMSGGARYRERPGFANTYRETYSGDSVRILRQDQIMDRKAWSVNGQLGADWSPDDYTTLTLSGLYRYGEGNNNFDLNSGYYNSSDQAERFTLRQNLESEISRSADISLGLRRNFPREGRELTADVQYTISNEQELLDARDSFFDENGDPDDGLEPVFQKTSNLENMNNLLLQANYTHPTQNGGKWETGFRSTTRIIGTEYDVTELDGSSGEWERIPTLSNKFNYNEGIHAVYGMYSGEKGRWKYQAGVRVELTTIRTELTENQEVNARNYLTPFPSLHSSYQLRDQNSLQFAVTGRISRPRFWYLNPFLSYTNPENIWAGNPNLDPSRIWNAEVGHTKYWNKLSMVSSVYYKYTDGPVQRITTIDSNGVTLTRPENMDYSHTLGLEWVLNADPLKWWKLTLSANAFYSYLDASSIDASYNTENISWTSRLNSTFTFWNRTRAQVMVNYRGPMNTAQGYREQIAYVDFGLSKDIMNRKGSVAVKVSDIFNSRKYVYSSAGDNFYLEGERQWMARQFTLSFTYRFGQRSSQSGKRRNSGGYNGGGFGEG